MLKKSQAGQLKSKKILKKNSLNVFGQINSSGSRKQCQKQNQQKEFKKNFFLNLQELDKVN